MKKLILAATVFASVLSLKADMWRGLTDENHYSGPKLTEEDLAGKVVMIDEWGVNCGPCKQLLPQMQKYWTAFKSKEFVLIGSHRQGRAPEAVAALVKATGRTSPMCDNVGLAGGEPSNGGGIPFIYVVNHRGRVVYAGRSDREAIEAAQNAFMSIGQLPSLTGDMVFGKKSPHKALEKQLVLGKPAASIVKRLEDEVKRAGSKAANPGQKAAGAEAAEILRAVAAAKAEIKSDIERLKKTNPPEALKLIKGFSASFPAEGKEYKEEIRELTVAAKEYVAAQKAKAAEAKKAKK